MWRFVAWCRFMLTTLALAASMSMMPSVAQADGQLGPRFLPASLAVDDPFVADELSFAFLHFKAPATSLTPTTVTSSLATAYAKRVTEKLGLTLKWDLVHLEPEEDTDKTGIGGLTVELKYEIFESAEHEALLSTAVGWLIGGTGNASVGAPSFDTVRPAIFFAKGWGDLPDSLALLKPLALTGRFGAAIPAGTSTSRHPDIFEAGIVVEYSVPYLQEVVRSGGPSSPLTRIVPLVELSLETPLTHARNSGTIGTIDPGIAWLADNNRWQLAMEAVIPINDRTGHNVGVRASLNLFLNRLFPTSRLFQPLIGN
jgi:hypothetical protein